MSLTVLHAVPRAVAADGLADLRAELTRLPTGGWLELKGSADETVRGTAISRVFPRREHHPAWGAVGPAAVVIAWSGGAYDQRRNRLLVNGGGHTDYGGNELYAFDVRDRIWLRITDPSRLEALPARKFSTMDNTPVSRHTYDGLEYIPELDSLFLFSGSNYMDGRPDDDAAWFFDLRENRWLRKSGAGQGSHPAAAYDPERKRVLVTIASGLYGYEPGLDRWTELRPPGPAYESGVAAFDAVRRLFVELRPAGLFIYDLGRRGPFPNEGRPVATRGDTEIEKLNFPGMEYDPLSRQILAWAGGPSVWALNTGTLEWRRFDSRRGPDSKSMQLSRGVYGRWRYVPDLDAFIGFNDPDGNVWLFRPPR